MSAAAPVDALDPGAGEATRAQRARSEPMGVAPLGGGEYDVVTGDDERQVYTVDLPAGRCTCPDARLRGARCKHLRRVAIEVTEGRVPAPGERAARCGACGRPLHAGAEEPDPVYCGACTLRPGETVVDRETEDLLVVVETTDSRARGTPVRGTGYTVATYPGNRGYAPDDRVIEAIYPQPAGTDPREDPPRAYSFPRGRLRRP
ncbi:MAG: SWIM zinc finger family protein [Halobacteriaceae archaeon]